jgi:hypothetical protein
MESPPVVVQPVGNIDFGQDILSATEENVNGPLMDNPAPPEGETIVEGPAIGQGETVTEGPDIAAPAPATQPKAAESGGWTAVHHHDPAPPEITNQ